MMFGVPFGFMGQSAPFDTDAQAYIDRTTGMTTLAKNAINTLIVALKSSSIWTNQDVLNVLSTADTAANAKANSKLNVKQNAFNTVEFGTGILFTIDKGFEIVSGTALNTTVVEGDPGVLITKKGQHLWIYRRKEGGNIEYMIGVNNDAPNAILQENGQINYKIQDSNNNITAADGIMGFHGTTLDEESGGSNDSYYGYGNSSGFTTGVMSTNNVQILGREFLIGARGNNAIPITSVVDENVGAEFTGWGLGSGLTLVEFQNLMTHLQTYYTTLGLQE